MTVLDLLIEQVCEDTPRPPREAQRLLVECLLGGGQAPGRIVPAAAAPSPAEQTCPTCLREFDEAGYCNGCGRQKGTHQ